MISLEWCNEYVDISDLDPNELAVKITTAGTNIEKVVTNKNDYLVIGYVKECIPHPDSDHMKVCQVDVGTDTRQIVCGASNVREGIKVIVALPGCVLPGDFKIEKAMKRGVESNGMICALMEIGLEENTPENYAKGIYEVDKDAPVGENALKYLNREVTTYELDIHKHRNNDCYYHIGFAYEIASIINRKVKLPVSDYKEDTSDDVANHINLKVETDNCPYYSCKMVKGVKIGDSPEFIKKRLVDAGMRSINNVVDISNYVMLEYGQPLHFFDKDTLGDNILVRQAKDDEKIITLDGKERVLDSKDIVITDGEKPVCIAGVMGGENTEVEESTKDILIEAAIFDAVSIRNTARKLDLRSEASIRYGKGLSYEYTKKAIDRACYLLEKYASGTVIKGEVIHDKTDKTPNIVKFKAEDVCALLGLEISTSDMEKELDRLDFPYELNKDVFTVTVPKRRLDIEPNVNDIAEEIGRLYGYENLASTLPNVKDRRGVYVGDVGIRKAISKRLRALGIDEVKTYTLVNPETASKFRYESKEQITLPNPMSVDKSVIRTTLIPSLLGTYDYNKARKVEDINIYEIAKTYDKDYNEDVKVTILMSGNYITNK
jgi:phenylalanyl-tRNA synthetase beta chain